MLIIEVITTTYYHIWYLLKAHYVSSTVLSSSYLWTQIIVLIYYELGIITNPIFHMTKLRNGNEKSWPQIMELINAGAMVWVQ